MLDFYKRYYPEVSFQFIFPCYNMLVSSKNVEKDHPLTKKEESFMGGFTYESKAKILV